MESVVKDVDTKTCGNVDNMCYCLCAGEKSKCRTTDLGWKWNNGIKNADGSHALNGTKGDGKEYVCYKHDDHEDMLVLKCL